MESVELLCRARGQCTIDNEQCTMGGDAVVRGCGVGHGAVDWLGWFNAQICLTGVLFRLLLWYYGVFSYCLQVMISSSIMVYYFSN